MMHAVDEFKADPLSFMQNNIVVQMVGKNVNTQDNIGAFSFTNNREQGSLWNGQRASGMGSQLQSTTCGVKLART